MGRLLGLFIVAWVLAGASEALSASGPAAPRAASSSATRPPQKAVTTQPPRDADRSSTGAQKAAAPEPAHDEPLKPLCRPGQEDRTSDLCAQWKAADAAALSANWAQWMGIATWIGVAIGAGTLIAAGLAAKYAKEAADHTADGARAARATADLAERSISELERPFLVFLPQPIANSGETTSPLAYSFANYGRTPCVILNAEVRYLHITPLNAPDRLKPNFLQLALAPDRIVVPPGAGPGAANSVRLGKPVVEDAERAGMRMVHGYALYRATSGRIYICGFGLYWSGEADGWRTVAGAYNYDDEVKPGWKPPDPVTMTIKVVPDDNQDQST